MRFRIDKTSEGALVLRSEDVSSEKKTVLDPDSKIVFFKGVGYAKSLFCASDVTMVVPTASFRGGLDAALAESAHAVAREKTAIQLDSDKADQWVEVTKANLENVGRYFQAVATFLHADPAAVGEIPHFIELIMNAQEKVEGTSFMESLAYVCVNFGFGYVVPFLRPYFSQAVQTAVDAVRMSIESGVVSQESVNALEKMSRLINATSADELKQLSHAFGLTLDGFKVALDPMFTAAYLYTTPKNPDGLIAGCLCLNALSYFVPVTLSRQAYTEIRSYIEANWEQEMKEFKKRDGALVASLFDVLGA